MLKATFRSLSHFPVQIGAIVAEHPVVVLKGVWIVQRPVFSGTKTNEGTSFAISEGLSGNSTIASQMAVTRYLGQGIANTTVDAVATEYLENISPDDAQTSLDNVLPSSRPEHCALYGRATLFIGDQLFIAPRRFTTKMWAEHGIPAYSYRFGTVPSGILLEILSAAYYAEVPFVFRNVNTMGLELDSIHKLKRTKHGV